MPSLQISPRLYPDLVAKLVVPMEDSYLLYLSLTPVNISRAVIQALSPHLNSPPLPSTPNLSTGGNFSDHSLSEISVSDVTNYVSNSPEAAMTTSDFREQEDEMKLFRCFSPSKKKDKRNVAGGAGTSTEESPPTDASASPSAPGQTGISSIVPPPENSVEGSSPQGPDIVPNVAGKEFTFQELAVVTDNFRDFLGEGGFGKVYKGIIDTGQVVAVKQLSFDARQGTNEFVAEVTILSNLHHENLVKLVGYCAEGDQRIIVYEYMPQGSLEDHLFDLKEGQQPLDWFTRMRIAHGAAKGLEYLHDRNPPVIFRDMKSGNILLDGNLNPKLSDFGLAKLGPEGDKTHVSTQVMGTHGYCAPEYYRTGHLKVKSDVYSFGVVILELISGRRAYDVFKTVDERNLVDWARPMLGDKRRHPQLIDPLIKDAFCPEGLSEAVAMATMCLQEEAHVRPIMNDVVMSLEPLTVPPNETLSPASSSLPPSPDQMSAAEGASTSGSN
ncbi:hypothetical protein LUZ61_006950 [Rhynchospora tenuis]|uniref:Protein kinase domain-containing protein n=1 Tax=Rhynchospora tenuis TaxID=198213 RepID=A0AAD5ZSK5_9POAL|nr:hypothetical protein LUZ61_006950 [Rhynchospora tenuis]